MARAATAAPSTPDQPATNDTNPSRVPVATDPDTSSKKDEAIELSPFEVDASQDRGYYGANTMSGTRLNTRVQDLGGSITVVTKQQLNDTAAVDINDIFKYEANTEGIHDYTALSSSSPTADLIQGGNAASAGPALATRLRGISAPNVELDYFTHTARIPIDSFFIDSVEISRGPNSTVAGLGSPSGTINTNMITANLAENTQEVQLRADDYGSYRTGINVNQVLLKDKLALRVIGLYSDQEFQQKPSFDDTKRLYGTFTYKPFSGTTIIVKGDYYTANHMDPNSLTPRDGVSAWIAAGEPTWNPLTYTATVNGVQTAPIPVGSGKSAEQFTLPEGLYANANTYTRPNMYIDNGQVQFWEVNRLATGANPNAATTSNQRLLASGSDYMRAIVNGGILYQVPGISNQSLYDWESVNAVPTNWSYDHAATYTAEWQQKVVDNLYFRVAWHMEDSQEYNRNITSPPTLQVDVNQYLLDGSKNPNFLRPYISSFEPSIYSLPEMNEALQLGLTYSYDATTHAGWTRWFGRHQFGANYENHNVTDSIFRYREAIIDPNHVWLTPGALNYTNGPTINRANYIYYVGPSGADGYTPGYVPPRSGISGQYTLNYYNGATKQWVADPATYGTANYVSSRTRQETKTKSFTWQGSLLKDHLVITEGYRRDNYRTRNTLAETVDPTTGQYVLSSLSNWAPWTYENGPTQMTSIVVYPVKNFGLTFSRASSFMPQPLAVDLSGATLPNTYGHGRDIGFFTNLLDGKLVFSLKFYKTNIANDRTSNTTIASRIARLDAGVLLPGTSADSFSLYNFAENLARTRLGASASQTDVDAAAAKITDYSPGFQTAVTDYINGAALRGTSDTSAKGAELEITYNPTPNWNIKFTGAKTEAVNESIEGSLDAYIASRMPYWQSLKDDQGNLWWTSTALGSQSAQNFYETAIAPQLKIDEALLGKSDPQVKKYTWRLLTNYRVPTGPLRDVFFGSAVEWDDKSVIGYLGSAPDSDGIVRSLDVNKPVYDPARYYFDFWVGYRMKMFHNKVRAKFQLNVQDAFEGGRLQAVSVNPDGTPYNYRIINPRTWSVTTTFDF